MKVDLIEIEPLFGSLRNNDKIKQMADFIQHGKITTLEHVDSVARLSYKINKRFRLGADVDALVKGAYLHDYYLYDWHKTDGGNGLHGFSHPVTAKRNAIKDFDIDDKIQNIIESHMWPLSIMRIPRCREAWIVCLADKCVAIKETLFCR